MEHASRDAVEIRLKGPKLLDSLSLLELLKTLHSKP